MDNEHLDFAASDQLAGFRLHRFEVYNWGTFHRRVWTLKPGGKNALLTGDIGSGKSTLVDAITTLLVSPQRVAYNKAAGADAKERSLRSYVQGYYKSERGDATLGAKPIGLRDHTNYSVVLAHFHNEGFRLDLTLAQVFWFRDPQEPPQRLYIVSDRPLSIANDFADFGADMADLRKRLRHDQNVRLYDHFPQYAADFRRHFGIESDQALDLFHQTVSMKSVGNLTDFVREHMLEAFTVDERIDELIRHFDDLDRAHESVLKAKAQIQALEPMVADLDRLTEISQNAAELRDCREALRPWFSLLKGDLLRERLEKLDHDLVRLEIRIKQLGDRRESEQIRRDDLKRAIADNGGDRLTRLQSEIASLQKETDDKRRRAESYQALATELGFDDAVDEEAFSTNRKSLSDALEQIEQRRADRQNEVVEAKVLLRDLDRTYGEVDVEIVSLKSRKSSIPSRMLELRNRLVNAIGVVEDDLPFAGELIQVRESEAQWEGAIERLLHNFGLSLIVPDRLYREVAEWVDRTHLRGRLVYFRSRDNQPGDRPIDQGELHRDSLVHKLSIRPNSEFYSWLERELARRFDYACCTDLDRFRREKRAITQSGQIKGGGERHEKDDRHAIEDRSRYVLGWSNEAKIAALEKEARSLRVRGEEVTRRVKAAEQKLNLLSKRRDAVIRLQEYEDYDGLDWKSVALKTQELIREREALTATSDKLRTLRAELEHLEAEMKKTEKAQRDAMADQAVKKDRYGQAEAQLSEAQALVESTAVGVKERIFPKLEKLRPEALGDVTLTVESSDGRQSQMREWLQSKIDAEEKRLGRLRERIIDGMRTYQTRWPSETREVDVSIEAGGEYRTMLQGLLADDLPRFEARFNELLRENTIREVAAFQARLDREREAIRERIEIINRSLQGIDYNPGRYIVLLAEPTFDPEVRDFRESLRACTEQTLTGSEDDQYSETKFLQVKAIIERFRGREGLSDLDRRWARKVTDVRNWFLFSASEKWREDDQEHEHYTDSGGKSGGQKEKLAYTVLAASLAYQFGLEWGETRSRSFRFVVIDEAFGRGSDESARYGLELFERLNLQVLVVTPLQKIHVIEPYVFSVSFIHNEGGRDSKVRNLTIEEYRHELEARKWVGVS